METALFYIALFLWSLYATHWLIFTYLPQRAKKKTEDAPAKKKHAADRARPQHSAHDGFRAYARAGELTVEDIVKALSREEP